MKLLKSSIILLLSAGLLLGACSVEPRGRTVVVKRPSPTPAASASITPNGKPAFDIDKVNVITLQNFDQAGYFVPTAKLVYGWLDDEHLAAVGVKLVEQTDGQTDSPPMEMTPELYLKIGTKGLIGQILSVDWQTGLSTEVHTVQDEVITGMGLTHDKSKLWYCSTGGMGMGKLSVSDISFKHDLLEVSDFSSPFPVWSSHDKLLGFYESSKSKRMLNIFDGVDSKTYMTVGLTDFRQSPIGINDDTGDVLFINKDGSLMVMNLSTTDQQQRDGKPSVAKAYPMPITDAYKGSRTLLADPDLALFLSVGENGSRLNVVGIHDTTQYESYENIINFALSDSQQYICLVKETAGGTADVFVADWNNGKITNEKLAFKGFVANGSIYFSPDDTKLYLEGKYDYIDMNTVAMVLKFK